MNKVLFSSRTDEWETPQDLFDRYGALYHFSLDVAASDKNHKCEKYFTKEDDGLSKTWRGAVWCNPPYGRRVGAWVQKAYESECLVVMLLPARTDTRWFHDYIIGKAEIRFIKGRLRFGSAKNTAPFPSMIVIYRGWKNEQNERFNKQK